MTLQKDKVYHAMAGMIVALLIAPFSFWASLAIALSVLVAKEAVDCHAVTIRTKLPWLPAWLVRPGTQDIDDILAGLAGWTVGAFIVLAIGL